MDKENVQTTECYSALKINELSNHERGTSPVVQWLKPQLPVQGVLV